jgi:hypothetical protein
MNTQQITQRKKATVLLTIALFVIFSNVPTREMILPLLWAAYELLNTYSE